MKNKRGGNKTCTPAVAPAISQALVSTTAAVQHNVTHTKKHNENMVAMHQGTAIGGARKRRGGTCATDPCGLRVAPTYAAGANKNMRPNGNQNIAAGLKLQAQQTAASQGDSVAGWSKVNKTQVGGSALGNFVESLNGMAGGSFRRRRRSYRKSRKRRRRQRRRRSRRRSSYRRRRRRSQKSRHNKRRVTRRKKRTKRK
jgi:hypothetical protein